jgi:hypothetical protein
MEGRESPPLRTDGLDSTQWFLQAGPVSPGDPIHNRDSRGSRDAEALTDPEGAANIRTHRSGTTE